MLGGTASITELVALAQAANLSHLALTDANALYGALAFDRACREAGIQPILGLTLSVAPPAEEVGAGLGHEPGHLVLLATGPSGYRSLCRLSSLIQGRSNRAESLAIGLGWQDIKPDTDGLVCLGGGRRGWIYRYLVAGNMAAASRYAAKLGGIFGDNAYLNLEIHRSEDAEIAREMSHLGRRFGLPTVAVQPVYYLEPADESKLRLLKAIDRNCPLEAITDDLADLHWQSPEEINKRFTSFPEALAQVAEIIGRCQPALPERQPLWPALDLPPGQTPERALAEQAEVGLADRYGPRAPKPIRKRLLHELSTIERSGYAPLFLIVADIVRFARQAEVPVSTRGSVANSLVAYCTGITTVDPIANDLLFERFLNPARANPPDIDLDFCSRRRDEVLAYVRRTYGADRVALVATVATMQPKSAVRETGKAYGLAESEIGYIVKKLPRGGHPDPRRRSRQTVAGLADDLEEPRQRQVVLAAHEIVDQPHHLSIHPGGIVITPGPLTDYVPIQWAPKGFFITQFDHQDLEVLGLPKLDLLGIRALTVLADTAELVRRYHDPNFRLDRIPLDDPLTGDLLEQGDTIGVFQCESAGARRTLRQLKTRSVFDLAVANAFFKPGPATGGMAQSFIRRYRGQETVTYLHPALEPILASTKGVLLFQEQILRVATEIAGLSWEQADHLRRGMSKFQAAEMEALQAQFVAGCCQPAPAGPAFSQEQAQTLWQQVLAFAGYGFNRGHATAYADVSYRCAFLKARWPEAFLCARLAGWGGFHHPAIYMAEAHRLGISVRPPHINRSEAAFTLAYNPVDQRTHSNAEDQNMKVLWMGLGQVRDLRQRSVRAIIAQRQQQPFRDLLDLAERVSLQTKELAHLIQCGALDGLGPSRAALLAKADLVDRAGSTRQLTFEFAHSEVTSETAADRLAWERHILGQPISVHPLDLVRGNLPDVIPLARLPQTRRRPVMVAGIRLPGWTGGPGFFLGDRQTYIMVKGDERLATPEPWRPLLIHGHWASDEWGSSWLAAEEISPLQ